MFQAGKSGISVDDLTGVGRSNTVTKAYINRAFSFLESAEYDPYKQYDDVKDPEQPNIKRTASMADAQTQVSVRPRYQRSNSEQANKSHKEIRRKNPNVINIHLDADEQSKKTNLRLSSGVHAAPPSYDNPGYQVSPVSSPFDSTKNSVSSYESLPVPLPPKMRPPTRDVPIPEDSPYVTNVSVISMQSGSDKTQATSDINALSGLGSIQPPKSWVAAKKDESRVDGRTMASTSSPPSSPSSSSCMSRSRWIVLIVVVIVMLVIVGTIAAIVVVVGKSLLSSSSSSVSR